MKAIWLNLFLILAPSSGALAQQSDAPIPAISLDTVRFEIVEQAHTYQWRRPPETRFVVLNGCGGGGAGRTVSTSIGSNRQQFGGLSAPVLSVIVPVSDDVYSITIGHGGGMKLNERGRRIDGAHNTVFSGGDTTITFPGASHIRGGQIKNSLQGEGSVFGPGAGLQSGDANAKSLCSGGAAPDGRGGNGFLIVQPVMDLSRWVRLLENLEQINAEPDAQAAPIPSNGTTVETDNSQ